MGIARKIGGFRQNPLAGRARGRGGSKVYRFEAKTGGAKSAPVPSGLGMNRVARSTSEKVVSVDSATVSTYTQERAGARDGPYRTRTLLAKMLLVKLKTKKMTKRTHKVEQNAHHLKTKANS